MYQRRTRGVEVEVGGGTEGGVLYQVTGGGVLYQVTGGGVLYGWCAGHVLFEATVGLLSYLGRWNYSKRVG